MGEYNKSGLQGVQCMIVEFNKHAWTVAYSYTNM